MTLRFTLALRRPRNILQFYHQTGICSKIKQDWAPVAQRIEQFPSKEEVAGSIPARRAFNIRVRSSVGRAAPS